MCDITDRTAAMLQVDIKITSCYTIMEAADRTLRTASGMWIFILISIEY